MMFFGAPDIEKLKAKGNLFALIRALDYCKDPAVCQAAAVALAELGHPRGMAALIQAVSSNNEHVRETAAIVLAHTGDLEAAEGLFTALNKSTDVNVRRAAAIGIGYLGGERAIKELLLTFYQRDREIYTNVMHSLVQIGKELEPARQQALIVEPLGDILEQTRTGWHDPGVETLEWMGWEHDACYVGQSEEGRIQEGRTLRRTILDAFEEMGWQPDESHIGADYWAVKGQWERCVQLGEVAVDVLIAIFKYDAAERQHAYQALIDIGPPAARKMLEALDDGIEEMNQPIFDALIKMGATALPEIAAALNCHNERVRRLAVHSLEKIGSHDAIVHLVEAYGDPDWEIRREAFQAMQRIGKPTLSLLITALNHPNNEVRRGVAYTLDTLGWKPARDPAGAAYWLAREEWDACVAIGAPAIAPLFMRLAHWDNAVGQKAIEALAQIGAPAVEPLISGFAHWSSEVSQRAAETLKLIGTPALGPLVSALKNDNAIIRRRAAETLGLIGDPRTAQFVQFLVDHDCDEEVSKAAAAAIKAIQWNAHQQKGDTHPPAAADHSADGGANHVATLSSADSTAQQARSGNSPQLKR